MIHQKTIFLNLDTTWFIYLENAYLHNFNSLKRRILKNIITMNSYPRFEVYIYLYGIVAYLHHPKNEDFNEQNKWIIIKTQIFMQSAYFWILMHNNFLRRKTLHYYSSHIQSKKCLQVKTIQCHHCRCLFLHSAFHRPQFCIYLRKS